MQRISATVARYAMVLLLAANGVAGAGGAEKDFLRGPEGWNRIADYKESAWFIYVPSITKTGDDTVRFWGAFNSKAPKSLNSGDKIYMSMQFLNIVNCTAYQYKFISASYYDKWNLDGRKIFEEETMFPGWDDAPPQTAAEDLINFVCEFVRPWWKIW